jgi:nucleoid DNA-binding protein
MDQKVGGCADGAIRLWDMVVVSPLSLWEFSMMLKSINRYRNQAINTTKSIGITGEFGNFIKHIINAKPWKRHGRVYQTREQIWIEKTKLGAFYKNPIMEAFQELGLFFKFSLRISLVFKSVNFTRILVREKLLLVINLQPRWFT